MEKKTAERMCDELGTVLHLTGGLAYCFDIPIELRNTIRQANQLLRSVRWDSEVQDVLAMPNLDVMEEPR